MMENTTVSSAVIIGPEVSFSVIVSELTLVIAGVILSKKKLDVNVDESAVAILVLVTLEDVTVSDTSTTKEMAPSLKVFEAGRVNVAL